MSTSSARVRAERPELVCKRTDADSGAPGDGADANGEVTFFERDREPNERTTRWITIDESVCVPRSEWR